MNANSIFLQILALALSIISTNRAAAGDTNSHSRFEKLLVFGQSTNGLEGALLFKKEGHQIIIYVHKAGTTSLHSSNPLYRMTNHDIPKCPFGEKYFNSYWSPVWIPATNKYCGLVVLRNAGGEEVPPLMKELINSEAFPKFMRWSILEIEHDRKHQISWFIDSVTFSSTGYGQVGFFKVEDYFNITVPGDYQLTIWPKLYKRSEDPNDDRDLYERIDVPPVTVPIKL